MKNRLAFKTWNGLMIGVVVAALLVTVTSVAQSPMVVQKGPSKADVIAKLKGVQARQNIELQTIDEAVKKRLGETTSLTLKGQDAKIADRRISRLAGQIEDLAQRRSEMTARRELLNNLIFTVDTKWSGQNLNQFLEHTFLDMATTDLSDASGEGRLWKFMVYSSIAIREVPEPREDAINVFENYLNFSGVLDPKTPALFAASRNYTNGNMSYSAKPISRERVGDLVEAQLKKMGASDSKSEKKAPADIELRLAPLAPPPDEPGGTVSGATTRAPEPVAPSKPAEPRPDSSPIPNVDPLDGASIPPRPAPNAEQQN